MAQSFPIRYNIIMKRKCSRLMYIAVCPSEIQLKLAMLEQCRSTGTVINGDIHSTGKVFKLHCAEVL